jgi:hypothetical protein
MTDRRLRAASPRHSEISRSAIDRADQRLDHVDAFDMEDLVKAGDELRVAVADQ